MKPSVILEATLACLIALAGPAAADCEVTDAAGDTLTPGSLGACIALANGNGVPDVITFDIAGAGGPAEIRPLEEYVLTEPGTTIDGFTQPGSSANTNPAPGPLNTTLAVSIDGSGIAGPGVAVFRIETDDTTIRGLNVHSGPVFDIAVGLQTSGCSNNRVEGCFIGTDISGALARPSGWLAGNSPCAVGVYLVQGAANNFIGSDGEGADPAAERNLVSGESRGGSDCGYGVLIDGDPGTASGNVIDGNLIGTAADAVTALGNNHGVGIRNSASQSLVANNLIAGNSRDGIIITLGDDSNVIRGNTIQSNIGHGIELSGSSAQVAQNTITQNGGWGISNHASPGGDFSPAGAGNDGVGAPAITGNTIEANGSGGIANFDSAPLQGVSLHLDNVIGDNNGQLDVQQLWFGAVEILDASSPPPVTTGAYTVTIIDAEGFMQTGAVQDGGLWGPAGFDSDNVLTWFAVVEYQVDNSGSFHYYSPHTIVLSGPTGGMGTHTFDGLDNDADDCTTGGCSPAGILTGGQYRYQVAEVAVGDDSDGDGAADGADCAPFDPGFQGTAGTPCDADSDGYCDEGIAVGVRPADCPNETDCTGALCTPSDCQDSDAGVHPGAIEGPVGNPTCSDSTDNDCDGSADSDDPDCAACITDEDCDDANPCTDDTCSAGACLHPAVPDGLECDDDLYCTDPDTCTSGTCGGPPRDCPDMITCTTGACDEEMNICFPEPVPDGTPCDDSDACTTNDVCTSGACAGEDDCDDDNPCTEDICDPLTGCRHSMISGPCDDGDACTMNDTCWSGSCRGDPLDADSDSYVSDSCGGDDCDDANAGVNPDAPEICDDSIDNDCDGDVDQKDSQCGGSGGCGCNASAHASMYPLLLLCIYGLRRRGQNRCQPNGLFPQPYRVDADVL